MWIEATVRHRRGPRWKVKPEAQAVDGKRHKFIFAGYASESENSAYFGETAWLAEPRGWPDSAPAWIASGDLLDIKVL